MTIGALVETLAAEGLLPAPPGLPPESSGLAATGVVYDSRRATPGSIFVALRGQKDDGAR